LKWVGTILGIATTYFASRYFGPFSAAFVAGFWLVVTASSCSRQVTESLRTIDHYARLASVDDLTGLANDRSFREDLRAHLLDAEKNRPGPTLALADVDRFKSYNDTYGHPQGDAALKSVATILLESGDSAKIYRIGGDEFAAILPSPDGALNIEAVEGMRQAIESHPWPHRPITISFGLARIERTDEGIDPSFIVGRADRALYRAKREGGNRVILHAEEMTPD
jgi:diguanylate cyclase (GGDEF)-like protein